MAQAETAVTAATEAGYAETANVTALRTSASSLNTTASTTSSEATQATSADTDAKSAYKEAASIPNMQLNLGTVRFNMKTGELFFNGKPMNDAQSAEVAAKCKELLARRR